MRFKNIQIILPFVSYALKVFSSPIFYSEKLDIGKYSPDDNLLEQNLLLIKNYISEKEQKLSSFEDNKIKVKETSDSESESEYELISDEVQEIISDLESEVENVTTEYNDDKFSDTDYLSINWNRTPEELKSIINKEFEDENKIIDEIENIPDEECSFESVIIPLEQKYFGSMHENLLPIAGMESFHPDENIRKISGEINSNFTANQKSLFINKKIYHKVLMVKENIKNGLFEEPETKEDKRLIDIYELNFHRGGVDIPDEQAKEYLNNISELSKLASEFYECLSTKNDTLSFKKEELEGLPDILLDSFEKTEKNGEEIYKIGVQDPNYDIISNYAKIENTRKRLQIERIQICSSNIDILKKAVNLRLKNAKMLGYPSHANYQLESRMAKSSENVFKFLEDIKEKTKPTYNKQLKELLELKKKEKEELNEPFDNKFYFWDIDYYLRIYMEEKYQMKVEEFKEYFPVNEVLKETLELFGDIFSIKFVEVKNPSVWNSDVRVFNAYDKLTEKLMGPIYFDLFKRSGKQEGFTTDISIKYKREDESYTIPSAAVFLGLAPQKLPDKPTLMNQNDILTLFHELGHAIHIVSSNVKWPTYKDMNIEFDFIEVPSQLLENWSWNPEVLTKISHHYKDNNKKIPKELIENIIKTKNVKKPYTALYIESLSMTDMKMHSITEEDENIDVNEIYNEELKDALDVEIDKDFIFLAKFNHLISNYDAGVYSYLWSEVYSTDIFYSQFEKNGIFNSEVGEKYRKVILEKSASEEAMDYLTEFLGREPNNEAFIKSITSEN